MSEAPLLIGTLQAQGQITGTVQPRGQISGSLSFGSFTPEEYEGPYTVTPSASAQTLAIENKLATADIVIAPIPNNYGLITWNGSTLTVS